MRFVAMLLAALVLIGVAYAAPTQRVVTIGGDVTEIVYALGEQKRVVGVDETSVYPDAVHALPQVGYLRNLKRMGPWFNVLDPDFNLHLREDRIASAWVVYKPTRDGTVTSLELFDSDDFCFAQLFGARKPGKPELQGWRTIAAALARVEGGAA